MAKFNGIGLGVDDEEMSRKHRKAIMGPAVDYGEIRIKFTDTSKDQNRKYTRFFKDPGMLRKEKVEVKIKFTVAHEET